MSEKENTLEGFQRLIDDWIRNTGNGYHSILTNTILLMEEVGEFSRVVSRTEGDQIAKTNEQLNYAEELTDILWVVLCLANQKDVNLSEELHRNIVKKSKRDENRYK